MWRCGGCGWMGGPLFFHGWPGMLVGILIVGLTIFLVARFLTSRRGGIAAPRRDRSDSVEILKARLAKGEIDPQEYARMRRLLDRP